MTETLAIHEYIAQKWKPELLGQDLKHRAQVSMLANVVYDLKQKITIPCYTTGKIGECYNAIAENLPKILNFKLSKGS